MTDNAPGWLPDPNGKHDHRYWDGTQWTENVADAGVAGIDAYDPALTADGVAGAADAGAVAGDATAVDTPAVADAPTAAQPAAPDATAAWPTAPGAPAPPPPYVAPAPIAAAAGGEGSKKGLLVGGGILAAIAVAVVAFLALGGGDDGNGNGNLRTELAAKFKNESNGSVSQSEAECLADYYIEDLGADAFKGIDLSDPDADPPKELEDEFIATGLKAAEECNIDIGLDESTTTTDGSSDGGDGTYGSDPVLDALYDSCKDGDYQACDDLYNQSPSGSEYETFGDTCGDRNEPQGYCVDVYGDGSSDTTDTTDGSSDTTIDGSALPPNFEELLADTYESTFNLSREKAECLASALAGAIEDGTINEDEAFSNFMNYLDDCNISLDEISGG